MVACEGDVVWNQVDTVLESAAHVCRVVDAGLTALGEDALALALVRWQPMLEVAAQLGHRTAFPYREYAALLEQVVAAGAACVVPAAAGEAHTAAWTEMNARVFPVSEARFLRDLAAASPTTRGLPCRLGARYRVRGGEVVCEPDRAGDLVTLVGAAGDPRRYRPIDLPAIRDRELPDVDAARVRADIEAWVRGPLAHGLARACAGGPALRLVLELQHPTSVEAYTLIVASGEARVERGATDDWDGLNVAAASMLWEVLQARRHWGDLLLAGSLRACSRAYAVASGRLQPLALGDIFLYHGLAYDEAVRRSVRREVAQALARGPA